MALLGARSDAKAEALDPLPGTVNYFIGDNPANWQTAVPTYSKINYAGVYPGVDLVYYGNQSQLEYDFVVHPHANPSSIALQFVGATKVFVDETGELVLRVDENELRWHRPIAYQIIHGERRELSSRYEVRPDNTVTFHVAAHDPNFPLVIDPVLQYATFLGGNDEDDAYDIAVDNAGNVYVTGATLSANFPTTPNAYRTTAVGFRDNYVTKLNSNGTAVVFSTYIGGSADDYPSGIAVDSSGNVYIAGSTGSANYPTRNAFQAVLSGGTFDEDVCLSKIGPLGTNLLYSTYLGGTYFDGANAVAADNSGNAFITGGTSSTISTGGNNPFPTKIPFQSNPGSSDYTDAFVAKFNTTLSGSASLIYSSWLGGNGDEVGYAIAIDGSLNAYVVGYVETPNFEPPFTTTFPVTANAFQPLFNRGDTEGAPTDGFLTKINAAGSTKVFSTFLGGNGSDFAWGVAVDSSTNVYVVGETISTNFYLANAIQSVLNNNVSLEGSADAFVIKFGASGSNLLYSTYLGGSIDEKAAAIAVDNIGLIYITGPTDSEDFPVTFQADQTNAPGGSGGDAFVSKINPNVAGAAGLIYSTYLGGDGDVYDEATAIAVRTNGSFFVCGFTDSTNFPVTPGAFQTNYRGGYKDGFVARFDSPADLSVTLAASTNLITEGSNLVYVAKVNNNGRVNFTGVAFTNVLPSGLQLISATSTTGAIITNATTVACIFGSSMTNNASATVTITVRAISPATVTNTVQITSAEQNLEPNTSNNIASAATRIRGIADLTLAVSASSPVFVSSNVVYTVGVTNKGPSTASAVLMANTLPPNSSFISATPSVGTVSNVSNTVYWSIPSLPNNAGASLSVTAKALSTATLTNNAVVTTFEFDPNAANSAAVTLTPVNPLADIAIVSHNGLPNPATVGENLTYSINLTNRGPSSATNTIFTDTIPANSSFVSALSSLGTCSQTNGVVTCNLGTFNTNVLATLTIVVQPTSAGNLTNSVVISSPVADGNLLNNSSVTLVIATGGASSPSLGIAQAGTNVILYWPTNPPGYSLQSKTTIQTNVWTSVTNAPVVIGPQFYVTNTLQPATKFYRLIK